MNPPDFINDEHWGKGGQYVIDPTTGLRVPAPPPAPATTPPAPAAAPTKKGK